MVELVKKVIGKRRTAAVGKCPRGRQGDGFGAVAASGSKDGVVDVGAAGDRFKRNAANGAQFGTRGSSPVMSE